MIDERTLECPHCGETRADTDSLIRHLGSSHKIVEKFLPAEFHLSRSGDKISVKPAPFQDRTVKGIPSKALPDIRVNYLEIGKKKFLIDSQSQTNEEELPMSYTIQKKIQNIRSIFGDSDLSD